MYLSSFNSYRIRTRLSIPWKSKLMQLNLMHELISFRFYSDKMWCFLFVAVDVKSVWECKIFLKYQANRIRRGVRDKNPNFGPR